MAETLSVVIGGKETGPEAPAPAVTAPAAPVTPAAPLAPNAVNPPVVKTERPAWLPEKFKDAEQMALAYGELERKLSGAPEVKPAAAPETKVEAPAVDPNAPKVETPPSTETQVAAALKANGFELANYTKEFNEKGALSPESYAALEKGGFAKDLVDDFIAGQKAVANNHAVTLFAAAGGQEEYGKMTAWAKTALTPAQIAAFNSTVTNANAKDAAMLAIQGLRAQYVAAVGTDPALVTANTNMNNGSDVFRSAAELTSAQKDPRYAKDPAYRADVMAKALRSNVL